MWMRASNNTTSLGIEFEQMGFTVNANGISSKKVQLTTAWARYDFVINFPSLDGKVVSGDTAYAMNLWFSAGSNSTFPARSGGMSHQSATIDIAKMQLIDGETYQYIPERSYQEEMALIGRYYEKSYKDDVMPGTVSCDGEEIFTTTGDNAGSHYFNIKYRHVHRTTGNMRTYSPTTGVIEVGHADPLSSGGYHGDVAAAIAATSYKSCVLYTFAYDIYKPSLLSLHYVKDSRF